MAIADRACNCALTPYIEQAAIFNAYNSQIDACCAQNTTIAGFGFSTLWCPSDGAIFGLRHDFTAADCLNDDCSPFTINYTSYACNMGTWAYWPDETADRYFLQKLAQMNGVFFYLGFPNWAGTVNGGNGTVRNPGSVGPVRLASITDGTSTTLAFSEHAHGRLSRSVGANGNVDFYFWNFWFSPAYGDTVFTTFYPINPWKSLQDTLLPGDASPLAPAYVLAASSFHPGGANFAFMDGSVRFLKDSINSWSLDPQTGLPAKATINSQGIVVLAPGTQGVYQALSTRNGGKSSAPIRTELPHIPRPPTTQAAKDTNSGAGPADLPWPDAPVAAPRSSTCTEFCNQRWGRFRADGALSWKG